MYGCNIEFEKNREEVGGKRRRRRRMVTIA